MSLEDYLMKYDFDIPSDKVFVIMDQVFWGLSLLHEVGYIHNDIKPTNIMIDEEMNVTLIDLGFATSFLYGDIEHKRLEKMVNFKGNLLFSSKN